MVTGQHRETKQRGSGSSTSRQEQLVERRWTHLAKIYGMMICPWISERQLAAALIYKEGEVLPEDHPCWDIVEFMDACEIKNDERKHPRFPANVSALHYVY